MKLSQQKLKIVYLMRMLLDNTDEEHPMTIQQMIDELEKLGVSAERKSIYNDIEHLKMYGLDICVKKTSSTGYYIGYRDFELPELKLLVDSVQSSKFITEKKSMELIEKIEKLTSRANASRLQRQVFITNRVKTPNEKIYYNVDRLNEAIANNKQITFKYFKLDLDKKKVYQKDGGVYKESPVALSWDDENYYLITYKDKYKKYVHYRVDKMENIEILDEKRELADEKFDLSKYSKKMFQMFGGEETDVTLRFENELVGVVYDRFGIGVPIIKDGEKHFKCMTRVAVSPQFYAWIFSFGNRAEIISPKSARDDFIKHIKNSLEQYGAGAKCTDHAKQIKR